MSKKNTFRNVLIGAAALALVGAFLLWKPLKAVYFSGVPANTPDLYLYVPTGASFDQLVDLLQKGGFIQNESEFRWVAEKMSFVKSKMRPGRFEIQPGWSNRELIQHLRAGKQSPIKLVLNTERLPEDVAGKVSRFIEADSFELITMMRSPSLLSEIGYTPETLIAAFIPNTYEMFWNTDAKGFIQRMVKESNAFWQKDNRMEKAQRLELSPLEVYTLASIVERETNYNPEKPTIAGVYHNRLKIGMKLQADPTSVFATRDFATRRVTEYHTTFDSPYNTYVYKGLPPGPISMASIPSIDAVLNREQHNYIYFCAKPDNSGAHAFAETFAGHNVNVDKFRIWMRSQGRL